jgi:hypothetical protein
MTNHPHGGDKHHGEKPADAGSRGDGGMDDPESGGGDQTKTAVESAHPDGKPHPNPPDPNKPDGTGPDGEEG